MLELASFIQEIVESYGFAGIIFGTFLSSSILPIPSEAVLVSAGLIGISPLFIGIFGGIGSTLGSLVGYQLGKGGNFFLKKYGKYFFINQKNLKFVESWFKKWGDISILIGRIIPFIPYKIFSIGSGLGKMDIKKFFIFTLIGSIPRCFLLSSFGFLVSLSKNIYLTIACFLAFLAIPLLIEKIIKK